MLPSGAIFELKMHQNAFVVVLVGPSPRTPLGQLTAPPRSASWFSVAASLHGRKAEGRRRGEGRGGETKDILKTSSAAILVVMNYPAHKRINEQNQRNLFFSL